MPVAFTACSTNSLWCTIAFWFTQSAGKYGTFAAVLITSYLYTVNISTLKEKLISFLVAASSLLLLLSASAWVNEHGTKKLIKLARPSHAYIVTKTSHQIPIDSIYAVGTEARHALLKQLITQNQPLFSQVDARVLDHWVEEAGYSFPSGHSFNAFLLATILAFSIQSIRHQKGYIKFFFVPYLWAFFVAVSRVSLGAHSALDVSVGASLGLLVGFLVLQLDRLRHFIIHKKTAL